MSLQLLRAAFARNSSITPRLRIIQDHRLLKKLESIHLINSAGRSLDTVKDNERLTSGLQGVPRNDLDHISELGEDFLEGFLQLVDLDAFFQVPNLL